MPDGRISEDTKMIRMLRGGGSADEPVLSVRGLSQSFKSGHGRIRALDGVSFDVMPGEVFGLVGESGSGKTTVGRIITGIYDPCGGSVSFLGETIRAGSEDIRERIRKIKKQIGAQAKATRAYDADGSMHEYRGNVNLELQNSLEVEMQALRISRAVGRKWHNRPHPLIRMVFQDPTASLNPRMTVGEAVGEALVAIGVRDRSEIQRRVLEALSGVGLPASAISRYPHEFSGGQRQRVGIARAIITEPMLLIADEPISALDVSVGAQVINLLSELAERMSLSVIFIAHDLSVVRHVCDRVGVMKSGRMVELAASEELFCNPRHPYTRALLSAIPPPDPIAAKARVRQIYTDADGEVGELRDIGGGHYVLMK